jgi:hypothetical protein
VSAVTDPGLTVNARDISALEVWPSARIFSNICWRRGCPFDARAKSGPVPLVGRPSGEVIPKSSCINSSAELKYLQPQQEMLEQTTFFHL